MKKVYDQKYLVIVFMLFVSIFSVTSFAQEDQLKDVSVADLAELNIEDLLNIEVVTASKSEEKLSDAPGIISVLTQDDLKRFGGTTLKDILERVPGLIGYSTYITEKATISARGDQLGLAGSHVLLLINGRPVRESLEGGIKSEIISTFPVNVIERVEVIKGPGSVLYGSQAFSAVINIITKASDESGYYVSGIVGNGGAYGTQADVTLNIGDLKIVAAGRYFEKADWETEYKVVNDGVPTSINVTMPDKGPGFFVSGDYKGFSFMGSYNKWNNYYIIPTYIPARTSYDNAEWKKTFGNLGYDADVNDSWSISTNFTYTKSEYKIVNFPSIGRDSYDFVGELTNFFKLSDKSNLIVGGLYNKIGGGETFYGAPPAEVPISDANRTGYALYAQIDYKLLDNLKGIIGAQFNKFENIDGGLVPRVGFIWYPVKYINVKALYGQAFRAPSINEFNLTHPTRIGDPNLKSEKVGTLDLSISYEGEQAQARVSYYNSKMTEIIGLDNSTFPAVYANNGEATIQGAEFEGKYYVNNSLYLVGSMLYFTAKDQNDNENITPIAKFGSKFGISYAWNGGITVSLFDIYQGDLDDAFKGSPNVEPGSYNTLNFYSNFNLNKLFNIQMKSTLSLFIQADNILDKEIWLPGWGLAPGQSIPYVQGAAIYGGISLSM